MSKDLHNDEEITIDLLEIANILKRNAGNIARVTGIFVVAAGVYLATATPVYESQALLRVKQPKGIGTSLLESMPMGNAMANTQLMNTYAEILKSRSVVVPVIQKTEQPNKEGKYPAYDAYVKGRITTAPFKDTEIMQPTAQHDGGLQEVELSYSKSLQKDLLLHTAVGYGKLGDDTSKLVAVGLSWEY